MPTDVENWKSEAYGREIRDRLFGFAEAGFDAIPDDERDALVDPEETDYADPMMHNTKRTWYPYAEDDAMEDAPSTRSRHTPRSSSSHRRRPERSPTR